MSEQKIYVGSGKKSANYDIVNVNLCLSDIPKEHIQKAQNGKEYVRLNVAAKREVGKFGDTHSVAVDTWKPTPKTEETKPEPVAVVPDDKDMDLPF